MQNFNQFNQQPTQPLNQQMTEQQLDQEWANWDSTADFEPLQPIQRNPIAPANPNVAPQPRLPRGCVWLGAIALAPVVVPAGLVFVGTRAAWRGMRGPHAAQGENVFQQIGHHFVMPEKPPATPVQIARQDKNVASYDPDRVVVENSPRPRVSRYQHHKIRQSEKFFR